MVEVLIEGEVEGFAISGEAFGAPLYVSATAGALADAAAAHGVGMVAMVLPTSEPDPSNSYKPKKILRVLPVSDGRFLIRFLATYDKSTY